MNKKCCICGPVKNCGPFLNKVFENIEKIGAIFEDYKIIIYYDKSDDDTLQKLTNYQKKKPRLEFFRNTSPVLKYRTHRIAKGRNLCIDTIREKYSDYPFFIMMDFDDVNCKNVKPEILQKYLDRDDWDALSFNTSPKYYDIWGLSIRPYNFSYNHFNDNVAYYYKIQDYVEAKLNALPDGSLLTCSSSFNGFAIYRMKKCVNCHYDGRVRLDLIPKSYVQEHMRATNSPLIFKDYGNVDGKYEDVEHRAFHFMMINKNNAKIRISKEKIFV